MSDLPEEAVEAAKREIEKTKAMWREANSWMAALWLIHVLLDGSPSTPPQRLNPDCVLAAATERLSALQVVRHSDYEKLRVEFRQWRDEEATELDVANDLVEKAEAERDQARERADQIVSAILSRIGISPTDEIVAEQDAGQLRELVDVALKGGAALARKQERELIAKSFEWREGEDPVGLQEAQAALEGLYDGADLHDPNCGLPEPGGDGHDRGCTCGVAAIHERFSEAIALALDTARKQRDEELRERLREKLSGLQLEGRFSEQTRWAILGIFEEAG